MDDLSVGTVMFAPLSYYYVSKIYFPPSGKTSLFSTVGDSIYYSGHTAITQSPMTGKRTYSTGKTGAYMRVIIRTY